MPAKVSHPAPSPKTHNINKKLAIKYNTTTGRVGQWEIFGLGVALLGIREWLGAILCWIAVACMGIGLSWKAATETGKPISRLTRVLTALASLAITTIFLAITLGSKPESDPWSNLQRLWSMPEIYSHAISAEALVKTDQHYNEGQSVAGVNWRQGSIETWVDVNIPDKIAVSNVSLELAFDAVFVHGMQVSYVPNIVLEPKQTNGFQNVKGAGTRNLPFADHLLQCKYL